MSAVTETMTDDDDDDDDDGFMPRKMFFFSFTQFKVGHIYRNSFG